jgi:ferredoxin/flavodoxin---NADP+ reductase
LRVAVVGSGPAGFYVIAPLLGAGAHVDLIERLPVPWGLVRFGVAPDHPEIKAVSRVFEKTAAEPNFRFFGNVDIGKTISPADLAGLYDAVVYTVGAQTDRRLEIPGEDLPGSWPATAFVAWYNGHPDFQHLEFDLSGERALVIGNGNVAVDVARMLSLTAEELSPTDTTDTAVMAIVESGLREIVMLGRRGPAQAAFTNPELKELGELAGTDVIVEPGDLELDPASEAALADARGPARRNVDLLREYAAREPEGKPKMLILRFLASPVEIRGEGKVEEVEVVHNMLVEDGRGGLRAVPTERRETIPCGLVLRSVGYRGVALPGVPFDESRGVIPNADGRVVDADGAPIRGMYCAGWIKRGPSGVIGTNKKDAAETAAHVLEDAEAGLLAEGDGDLGELLDARGLAYVDYEGWQAIDRHEQGLGAPHGRPRTKLASWDELLHHGRRG